MVEICPWPTLSPEPETWSEIAVTASVVGRSTKIVYGVPPLNPEPQTLSPEP